MLAWTPYATVLFYSVFFDKDYFSPITSIITACIAKSSMMFSSAFFIYSFKEVKSALTDNLLLNEINRPRFLQRNGPI